jgi:hypothetical protein
MSRAANALILGLAVLARLESLAVDFFESRLVDRKIYQSETEVCIRATR